MANQEFQAYVNSRTEDTTPDIANDFLPIYDASATTTKKVKIESIRTRMFASGSIDGGGLTSFELPNSATPTVDADGEIAVDTSVADFSHGIVKVFAGEELALVALPIAELTTPTDGHVIAYNATNDEFELVAPSGGGIGGSTGSTDNAILRADGTGGATVQGSGSTATLDDNGQLTLTRDGLGTSLLISSNAASPYSPKLILREVDTNQTAEIFLDYRGVLTFAGGPGKGVRLGGLAGVTPKFEVQAYAYETGGVAAKVNSFSATTVGLAIQQAGSPTANPFEIQNSSASVLTAFDATGAWKPASMADSAAPNNSVYYSTTASKLVYKDSGGTVNNLY